MNEREMIKANFDITDDELDAIIRLFGDMQQVVTVAGISDFLMHAKPPMAINLLGFDVNEEGDE